MERVEQLCGICREYVCPPGGSHGLARARTGVRSENDECAALLCARSVRCETPLSPPDDVISRT
jgi:hypothetical protein